MIRVNLKRYQKAAPTEKMLTLVFAIVGRDKATELRFDYKPSESTVRLWYWVRDELLELVPPPAQTWPEVVRILLKDTEPAPRQKRPKRKTMFPDFPFSGKLPVQFGRKKVNFDILFFRGRTGEHIWVERESNADVSDLANEFWRQWHESKRP